MQALENNTMAEADLNIMKYPIQNTCIQEFQLV